MLKSIIQNEPFCPIFRQREPILIAVFAYAKPRPAVESMAQQSDFVGCFLTVAIASSQTSITPRQDRGTMSFRGKPLRNPQHHRRLARAPDGQVPHADYGTWKPPAAQEPMLIKGGAQPHRGSIKQTQRL
jgi:streptogramin lyase